MRMLAPGGYDPTDLVWSLALHAEGLGVVGLHSFTFNSGRDTAKGARRCWSASRDDATLRCDQAGDQDVGQGGQCDERAS